MKANPKADWKPADIRTVARAYGLKLRQRGTSHAVLTNTSGEHLTIPGPHFSPAFVARASRCRGEWAHGLRDTEGIAGTMSKWLEGVRPLSASISASAVGGWGEMRAEHKPIKPFYIRRLVALIEAMS